jgi:hypothetical protein
MSPYQQTVASGQSPPIFRTVSKWPVQGELQPLWANTLDGAKKLRSIAGEPVAFLWQGSWGRACASATSFCTVAISNGDPVTPSNVEANGSPSGVRTLYLIAETRLGVGRITADAKIASTPTISIKLVRRRLRIIVPTWRNTGQPTTQNVADLRAR